MSTHNRHNESQKYALHVCIKDLGGEDGVINLKQQGVAALASEELGFTVSPKQACTAAETVGVKLRKNVSRGNGAADSQIISIDESTVDALFTRLDRMERKISVIMTKFNLQWIE